MSRSQITRPANPVYLAYQILHVGFALLPIIFGLDKFLQVLVRWDQYVAPVFAQLMPFSTTTFMYVVGVVEIVAGGLVAYKPRYGALVVAVWLWVIVINLVFAGFYDIALRDLGLSLGALALALLSRQFD